METTTSKTVIICRLYTRDGQALLAQGTGPTRGDALWAAREEASRKGLSAHAHGFRCRTWFGRAR